MEFRSQLVFFSSDVIILVKFTDQRSRQSLYDLVLLPLWALFMLCATLVLSGFDVACPVTSVFAWFLRIFQSRIGARDYSLNLPLLASYCALVMNFGNQISV